jgi:hypothetical protein
MGGNAMSRSFVIGALSAVAVALFILSFAQGQFGTAAEAKAMLEKADAELEINEATHCDAAIAKRPVARSSNSLIPVISDAAVE